jgi:hypothetical protein
MAAGDADVMAVLRLVADVESDGWGADACAREHSGCAMHATLADGLCEEKERLL